jgi:transitional endoplasmic reticulum ATPase
LWKPYKRPKQDFKSIEIDIMDAVTKPILFNGFVVKGNLKVKNRIDKVFFTEIYELTDGSYLYLYLDLNPNEVMDRRDKFDVIRIKNESQNFVGVIVKQNSRDLLVSIKEELISAKGFECIAGMGTLKRLLIADVINPLKHPENFKKFKVSIPNGIILFGPPGCGKTFIIRKLAEELQYNFYEVKHSDLATPYIHGSVSNIGKVFAIAKENAPCVLFFDEISGLIPNRKKLQDSSSYKEEEIDEFLIQLNDAADKRILVVGATNYIDRLDPAAIRPGRFDKKIYVPPPDFEARKALFEMGLSNRPFDKNINFEHLAEMTDGFTCADIIEDIVESAARAAANLNKTLIDQGLIESEIARIRPRKVEKEKNEEKSDDTSYIR